MSIVHFALVMFAIAVPGVARAADGATLVADYRFHDNFGSSATEQPAQPPPLANIASAGGPENVFQTETVDGGPRRVLGFPEGNGLQSPFDTADPAADSHSIAVLFRVAYNGVGVTRPTCA
jgi:hypothetical protein